MGKFTNSGPDWTDVANTLRAVEDMHQVKVSLLLQLDGARDFGCLEIIGMAVATNVSATGQRHSVSRKHWFPNQRNITFEGTCYNLLYELDKDCSSMWKQETAKL